MDSAMDLMVNELSEDEQSLLRSLLAEDNKTMKWLLTMTHKPVNAPPYDISENLQHHQQHNYFTCLTRNILMQFANFLLLGHWEQIATANSFSAQG